MTDANEPRISINPADVPDRAFQAACPVLEASIKLALSDPEKRRDFEQWKKNRERENR